MVTCCSSHSETHFTHVTHETHMTHVTHFTHVTKAFLSLSLPREKERYSVCNRSISLLYWFYIIDVSGGPNINQKAGNVRDSDLQGWSQQIVQMAPTSWRVSTNSPQFSFSFFSPFIFLKTANRCLSGQTSSSRVGGCSVWERPSQTHLITVHLDSSELKANISSQSGDTGKAQWRKVCLGSEPDLRSPSHHCPSGFISLLLLLKGDAWRRPYS